MVVLHVKEILVKRYVRLLWLNVRVVTCAHGRVLVDKIVLEQFLNANAVDTAGRTHVGGLVPPRERKGITVRFDFTKLSVYDMPFWSVFDFGNHFVLPCSCVLSALFQ